MKSRKVWREKLTHESSKKKVRMHKGAGFKDNLRHRNHYSENWTVVWGSARPGGAKMGNDDLKKKVIKSK